MSASAVDAVDADDPVAPCHVAVDFDRPVAFVGEQAVHDVRIAWQPDVARVEWLHAPSYPHHRVEALAADPAASDAPDHDPTWQIRHERRALFAGQPGILEVPESTLRCVFERGDSLERSEIDSLERSGIDSLERSGIDSLERSGTTRRGHFDIVLPALRVEARQPPIADQPDAFDGLIGPVDLRRSVDRRRVDLGETLVVTMSLSGPGNVWVAAMDPSHVAISERARGADAIEQQPTHANGGRKFDFFALGERIDKSVGERVTTRRVARFEVVARRVGQLELPSWSVDWLDPRTGRYRTSEAPALVIEVAPRATAPRRPEPADRLGAATPSMRDAQTSARDGVPLIRTLLAAIVVAAAAFAAVALLYRGRPGRRSLDSALASARAARAAGDARREADALDRAIRARLAMRSPALAGLSPPELEARAADDEMLVSAAWLLADIEAARYGSPSREPNRDAIRAWLAQ